mgnify:CR=1 FL=1
MAAAIGSTEQMAAEEIGSVSAIPTSTDTRIPIRKGWRTVVRMIGYALQAPPMVLFSLVTVGYACNVLGGAGGPLAVLSSLKNR